MSLKVGIFYTGFIGDIALCGLLIEGLYREGHEITLIGRAPSTFLYTEDSRIKNLVTVNKKKGVAKLKTLFTIAQKIKELELDILLVPHKSYTSALVSYLSGVRKRISYDVSALRFLYTDLVKYNITEHESRRLLKLAQNDLISSSVYEELYDVARPVLHPTENFRIFLTYYPDFLNLKTPYFIINPGSVWETKKYPADKYARLAYLLIKKHNSRIHCVLCGGPGEKADVDLFLKYYSELDPTLTHIINAAKCMLPLNEFLNLTAKAEFMIANDSAPVHIASGVNIPVAAIFGPTTWHKGFGPSATRSLILYYKAKNGEMIHCHPCSNHGTPVCPQKHFRCMLELAPERLAHEIFEFMQK